MLFVSCTVNGARTDETEYIEQYGAQTMDSLKDAPTENDAAYTGNPLNPQSIKYLGAFLLPDDGETEREMFSYGGEALCYNKKNGSLYITGHNWYADVAEITIPEPEASKDLSKLNKAQVIQGLTDIKGALFDGWSMEIPRAGLEVIEDNLFFCYGQHFEEDNSLGTHGYTYSCLSGSNKVCTVGDKRYTSNDYMFSVPEKYISLFGGADLLTGRFRDGGWGGMGPSLYSVKSQDIINSQNNEKIEASLLIGYDDTYNGEDGAKVDGYSNADWWSGGAFISCSAGDAAIFEGTHGLGDTWYGFSNGVVYPTSGDEDEAVPEVPEYPHDERGWWNDDYRAYMMFYDASDILGVLYGELEPYEIQPYAFCDLSEYMIAERDETVMQYLGACAYDLEGNRLFILELMADEARPVVHVFTFEGSSG